MTPKYKSAALVLSISLLTACNDAPVTSQDSSLSISEEPAPVVQHSSAEQQAAYVALIDDQLAQELDPVVFVEKETAPSLAQYIPEQETLSVADSKPDFSTIADVKQKKAAFFDFIRPAIEHENQRIEREREFLLTVKQHVELEHDLDGESFAYLEKMAKTYRVDLNEQSVSLDWIDEMLVRVDGLPESLVLSQAAKESGWGTSRFATQGNNYFGQWCYRQGCGMVPLSRNTGANHEVAVFGSPYLSVQAYFMNVNRHNAYQELREIRAEQRRDNQELHAHDLAQGLLNYSERGMAYVEEIQAMLRYNQQYWQQG